MNKSEEAFNLLKLSIKQQESDPDNIVLIAAVIKAFEISFEYTWKSFKKIGTEAGYEIYNPRDAIKAALEIGLIEDFDKWKEFLNSRNLSVHDYLGVSDKEILLLAKSFLKESRKIKWGMSKG